jgi:hypothetical protein
MRQQRHGCHEPQASLACEAANTAHALTVIQSLRDIARDFLHTRLAGIKQQDAVPDEDQLELMDKISSCPVPLLKTL